MVDIDDMSIESIKKHLERLEQEPTINKVTQFPSVNNRKLLINNKWAVSMYTEEEQGADFKGAKVSGHLASVFLFECDGTWYDENGHIISGYLYFKPSR